MKLAGVVITNNEQRNIDRCLQSLRFCDEIVVVDSESSDETVQRAKNYTNKVFVQPWLGYSRQKNLAIEHTECDWILSVDADEEVSPRLRDEILKTLKGTPQDVAYWIPRKTLHSGRWIRFGGWYPNHLVRLFRKDSGSWVGDQVHEKWEPQGKTGYLREDLLHHSFESISDQVQRNDRYSTLGALALHQDGQPFRKRYLLAKPVTKFLESYLLKQGFRDGYRGFIIAVSAAYSVFLKWAKLWELERQDEKEAKKEKSLPRQKKEAYEV